MTADSILDEFRSLVSVSVPDAKRANSANRGQSEPEMAPIGTIGSIGSRHAEKEPTSEGEAADWHRRHREHLARVRAKPDDDTREQAAPAAYDRLISDWHREHGAPPPEGLCAGCGGPLSGNEAYGLHDGARLHDDACLIRYGLRWRSAAAAALARLGIAAPGGWKP
jgi:hypothetical protein